MHSAIITNLFEKDKKFLDFPVLFFVKICQSKCKFSLQFCKKFERLLTRPSTVLQQNNNKNNLAPNQLLVDLQKTLIQSTAIIDCQSSNIQLKRAHLIHSTEPNSNPSNCTLITATSNSPSCEILKSSFISPSSSAAGDSIENIVLNDVRPFSALYDIICKEKQIDSTMSNTQQSERLLEKLSYVDMGLSDQNGSFKDDPSNAYSETEHEQTLDRKIYSQSTSQNSKFIVETDCNNSLNDLESNDMNDCVSLEMDLSCVSNDSTLIQTFCLSPNETSLTSLSLITASNTRPHTKIKSPTETCLKISSQNGSDSEKSSGGVGGSTSMSPTQTIRTTKASRLRAAALDKKLKLNGNSDQRRPNSPSTASNKSTSTKLLPQGPPTLQRSKKLVPSINVSVQQTLNEHSVASLVIEQKSTLKRDPHSPRKCSDESSGSQYSPQHMERDKSSKRKSNLNRSLAEESTDDSHVLRRRYRRELEGTKSLIPRAETLNSTGMTLGAQSSISNIPVSQATLRHIKASSKNGSVKGNYSSAQRLRSSTLSPKTQVPKCHENYASDQNASDNTISSMRSKKSSTSEFSTRDTKCFQKNKRLMELSHKMEISKERTKAELAEIEGITARCNNTTEMFPNRNSENVCDLKLSTTSQDSTAIDKHNSNVIETDFSNVRVINKSFHKKDRISFLDDNFLKTNADTSPNSTFFKDRRRSHSTEEKYTFCDAVLFDDDYTATKPNRPSSTPSSEIFLLPKNSTNLRRKSSEDGAAATNHIVSILKKKDHNESSSASSNASPVTFSSSVVDTPTRTASRQGILKKRSSLDEGRYSRSHSPDERSVLVRTPRRNSLEELQHGILKQRSYDSKTDLPGNNEPHSILKKKENFTPSETYTKHVSISEAVILAAAELCKDAVGSDDEYGIRPILKQDTPTISTPRPILKKKYSSESEEIRPILKTSRKSSREESDNDDYRMTRKSDSPAKRRSFCDPFETNVVLERSRSMENHDSIPPVVQSTTMPISEKPLVSVAERISHMEKVLMTDKGHVSRRENNRQRFKTQPVTVNEISWSLKLNALNKFPSPLNHRNHDFETDFHSSTLLPQDENQLYLSADLCLTSLSSDSGILTAKLSDMSNSGEFDKSPIRQQMENYGNEKCFGEVDDSNKTENREGKINLSRSDSVRARANMFQAMEEQRLKMNTGEGQRLTKSRSYISSTVEKVADFDVRKEPGDSGAVLNSDSIKTKLLQEFSSVKSDSSNAFLSTKKPSFNKGHNRHKNASTPSTSQNRIQCYTCNQYGHKSFECPEKKKKQMSSSHSDKSTKKGTAFVVYESDVSNEDDWYLDSAAEFHMSPRADWIVDNVQNHMPVNNIVIANGSSMKVQASGKVFVDVDQQGVSCTVPINNLFSRIMAVKFLTDKFLVATGRRVNNMFVLNRSQNRCLFTSGGEQRLLWHRRLGHLNLQDLCKLKSVTIGMDFKSPKTVEP
ncbi:hypothetical protein Bhyg_07955, partial [Pseudolycoriella hygida]